MGFRLGVDYGTSNTVAVLRWPDGRTRSLLFDGAPLLPSAVYAGQDGGLLVGRDAQRSARWGPARFEPNPKRRVDDLEVLLGDRAYPLPELVAAVLRRVAAEAVRTAGGPVSDLVMTCPVEWGAARRKVLVDAAGLVGLPMPRLVPEPVAAASYFVSVLGHQVPSERCVVVYDLGGGTFDASVVRRTAAGFEPLAVRGLEDFGGVDLDAMVVAQIGEAVAAGENAALWGRLTQPGTEEERRAFRLLWDDARSAKEALSRSAQVPVAVPLVGRDVHVSREAFEATAGPELRRTAELTAATIRAARIRSEELAGVFLVGGSSRVPMVATVLHQVLGIAPTVLEQPEMVVAEGALHASGMESGAGPNVTAATGPPLIPMQSATVGAPAMSPPAPNTVGLGPQLPAQPGTAVGPPPLAGHPAISAPPQTAPGSAALTGIAAPPQPHPQPASTTRTPVGLTLPLWPIVAVLVVAVPLPVLAYIVSFPDDFLGRRYEPDLYEEWAFGWLVWGAIAGTGVLLGGAAVLGLARVRSLRPAWRRVAPAGVAGLLLVTWLSFLVYALDVADNHNATRLFMALTVLVMLASAVVAAVLPQTAPRRAQGAAQAHLHGGGPGL